MTTARERFNAFRKASGRPATLRKQTVAARGLDFAVFATPPVDGAPPLVCVNGGMVYSHALLWPALAPLAHERQVILYDLRGRGASQAPPGVRAARIEHDALDLLAIAEAIAPSGFDLLAHSWGGGIAMLAAADTPPALRRLVLVDAVGAASEWLADLHTFALARLADDPTLYAALAAWDPIALHQPNALAQSDYNRALYPAWFHDRALGTAFAPPRAESETGAAVVARLRREGYDWRDRIGTIRTPTLLLHGTSDLIPVAQAERTASLLHDATLVPIPDAGHMPFWEQPELFFGRVRAFLNR
ncbi:MAG: alpha/beta fold hydrolase [Gemmatimonadaceae bacterium]|nr:alpha/beta fold hydrolase [Gemmatimonadaceae bacterium]